MELERGTLSRRGFLDRSLAALTSRGPATLVCPRSCWRTPGAESQPMHKAEEGGSQRPDRDGGHRRRRPGHRHHEMGQEQARRQVRRRLRRRRQPRARRPPKEVGKDCHQYNDFRELLAKEKLDAVTIGTVDHWHALTSIAAMKAGCDVYCEKPLSLTIEEGKAMVKAARKYDRVFQTGSQQRSDARYRLACELVRNGRIGKVHTVEARIGDNPIGGPFPKVSRFPKGWTGISGKAPPPTFPMSRNAAIMSSAGGTNTRGGKITDWGAHHNDIAQWGLGMDGSGPVSVTATGVTPSSKPNCYNCHPHFAVTYRYANGAHLITTSDGENGNRFIGDEGWIFVNRERIEASDPKLLDEPLPKDAVRLYVSNDHMGNFMDGIRTRKRPICDVEVGYRSVTVCHMGAIALRLGIPLDWDPKAECFVGPARRKGNAMVSREMRSPWRLEV